MTGPDFTIDFPVIVGFAGAGCIVIAYLLITTTRLKDTHVRYHLLNFAGAAMLLYSLFYRWNLPTVIIECIWMSISSYGIYRCLKLRKSTPKAD